MNTKWDTNAQTVRRSARVFIDALSVSNAEADCEAIAEFVVLAVQRASDLGDDQVGADSAGTNEALAAGAIYALLAALHLLDQRGLSHDEAILAVREQLG